MALRHIRGISYCCLLMFLGVMMIAGCASTKPRAEAEKMEKSGFLSSYEGFKPGPKGGADWLYIKEGVDFAKYNKVMFDQVTFFLKENAKYKGIKPDDIKELTDAFNEAVRENIGKSYELVETPGPDTMRIRVALTDLEPSKPGISAVSTVLPIGLGISMIKKEVTGRHTGVGETSAEIEVLDSQSNERIAAAIDTFSGGKLSGLKRWGSAEEAFKFWTERIRIRLDEFHGKKP